MTNRLKISLLVTGLILAASSIAGERNQDRGRMHQRGGPDIAGQIMEHLGRAVRNLDLTEDQKVAIREEFGGFKETVMPLVKELHQGRKGLHLAITGETYDADAVAAIATQQGELTTEITLVAIEAAAAVLAQLSDEQRAELRAMAQDRRAHFEERRKIMKEHRKERRGTRNQDGSENA